MSIAKHHAEWLSLLEVSGPFLSLPVLVQRFPQGLDNHDPDHFRLLRQVHEEWEDNQHERKPDLAIHNQWIKWVLKNTLDLEEVLIESQGIPQTLKAELPEHGETLRPDMAVMDLNCKKPRLLIQTYPLAQRLLHVVDGKPWKAAPDTRMMQLLHDTGARLGLVTNGDQWMLVDAPSGETTGYASWYSSLWLEEPKTLQAFRTFLGSYRFFGVPDDETLESLLARSAEDQQEVTDQLGYQVRRAVEVLVQSLDKANRAHSGQLLADVAETALYESALTVMMRLVFLFCAEERELLLLGDELYDKNYAVSTLREQLRTTADDHGEEILERRHDAWNRLLTTFRAVFGGVQHDRFKIPAYGGNLFDPDRFPFLEGRLSESSWKDTSSQPIPINNRTVLHLLEALQILQIKLPGGGPAEPRKLSFRALDIEQIGHVYEGLLDHTAVRATEPVLGLRGTRDNEPEMPLAELEALAAKSEEKLHEVLKKETGRSSVATIKRLLEAQLDDTMVSRFRTACQGDEQLWARIKPFAGLVRTDTFDYPVVIVPGSVYVTAGTDRRSSGTHYTPRSLTEPIVRYTLEPLVYEGPAEGKEKSEWRLKSAAELLNLNICDMACGSGAFLVQACRYMSERLLEAWEAAEKQIDGTPRITPSGDISEGASMEQLIPSDTEERLVYARRIVASRCLYGVDKNPLAVEMAKLSLWLLTLAKDKPFEFLNHAICCGDSLVGLNDIEQLRYFSLKPNTEDAVLFKGPLEHEVDEAINIRLKLEGMPANTVEDVEAQEKLAKEADEKLSRLRCAADLLVAAEFWSESAKDKQDKMIHAAVVSGHYVRKDPTEEFQQKAAKECRGLKMFHWPLEFPEVIVKRDGFDALVGNPPFMGGSKITGSLGDSYRSFIVENISYKSGNADLVAYFFLRAASLLDSTGALGLLSTKTISQGDTREVCLDQLVQQHDLYSVNDKVIWPGTAAVVVSRLHIFKGHWQGIRLLNDTSVPRISAFLSDEVDGIPNKLSSNKECSYTGNKLTGMGFIVDAHLANEMLNTDKKYASVLFRYMNGTDLNGSTQQEPSRWCITFWDWPEAEAKKYPLAYERIKDTVKPERMHLKRKSLVDNWWIHGEKRPAMYHALGRGGLFKKHPKGSWPPTPIERVLVITQATKHLSFCFVRNDFLIDQACIAFPYTRHYMFALLTSNMHELWVRKYSSTLGSSTMYYTPSDVFETFPFPTTIVPQEDQNDHSSQVVQQLDDLGRRYHLARGQVMRSEAIGLTGFYNAFHSASSDVAAISELRDLKMQIDTLVSVAYGWNDIRLGHGFFENARLPKSDCIRFSISDTARKQLLQRLLKLNHERYEEEVRQGIHDKKKNSKPKQRKQKDIGQETLF